MERTLNALFPLSFVSTPWRKIFLEKKLSLKVEKYQKNAAL